MLFHIFSVITILHVNGNRLPCQKRADHKKIRLINTTDGKLGLRGKLKLSEPIKATKAVADSCCGNKPYSSATNQCCFGHIVALDGTCCFNGKFVKSPQECSCSPPRKWVELELSRIVELISSIDHIRTDILGTMSERQEAADEITAQIETLDGDAGELERKFYNLVELEYGDPEAQNIQQQILSGSTAGRRRRMRRFSKSDEYVPDYVRVLNDVSYDSEPEYDSEEPEYSDEYGNYEPEPDDEEAHIAQVINVVQKRQKIRVDITQLATTKREVTSEIEQLHHFVATLLSIQTPTDEIQALVDTTMEFSNSKNNSEICDLTSWQDNISYFLDVIESVANGIDQMNKNGSNLKSLIQPVVRINEEIRHIHLWHEQYDRKQAILTNANYEEELEEYTQDDP